MVTPLLRLQGETGTSLAAKEFISSKESLPERLENLLHRLDNLSINEQEGSTIWLPSKPEESRRISVTAAIWASAPPSLENEFATLFAESLEERQEHEPWFTAIQRLQWLKVDSFLAPVLANVVQKAMQNQVEETIGGDFEQDDYLESINAWKDESLAPWVSAIVADPAWETWLDHLVLQEFCHCRMRELFDLVADYPDSHPAVKELGPALVKTQLHDEFSTALQTSLCHRLLHPGANTSQIIDVYINTIKVLREIDPSDRLLQQVAEPVRTYLRGRQDTVRCIITSLTDQDADLYQELRRQDAKPLQDTAQEEPDEDEPTMDWMPPPRKKKASFFDPTVMTRHSLDILSILVSIYGSKELFVDEYRVMLADKLLSNLDYNTDQELHTLELLKLRFGDASMRQCEIMVKDTDDSKRILTNIRSKQPECVVDAAIISHIFWPTIAQPEAMHHHPRIQAELDVFSTEYGQLKNPRRLVWYNQLGTVQLELDVIQDGIIQTKSVTCSPLQATLISFFEDKIRWSGESLSTEIGLSETTIVKRMQFWINHRVVVQDLDGSYLLASAHQWTGGVVEEEESDEIGAIGGNMDAEQDELFSSYITGMLKRYKELPLHRIHEMLKLFARGSDTTYNKTPRQLSALLQRLCRQETLECGPTGMYKLVEK